LVEVAGELNEYLQDLWGIPVMSNLEQSVKGVDGLVCVQHRVFLFPSFQQASYIGVNLRSPQPLLDGAPWIEQGIRDYPGEWYHATPSIFPGIKG
jgi:hypothetical protein